MIELQVHIPQVLSQIVKSFWCLRVTGHETAYTENMLPDGHHEIIFLVAGNARRNTGEGNWIQEPASFFAGQTLHNYSLELQNNSVLYGIRFYPHTLHHLFGFPADDITDNLLPLYEMKATSELQYCVTEHPAETFRNFEAVLMKLCHWVDTSANKFRYIEYAVKEIIKNKGNSKIEELVGKAGVSQRYFDTLFKRSVGINPKQFCNIIRLNHFVSYRNNHPAKNLTECCYEAGFFDQSHLVKLFNRITGTSPKKYFNNANHINDYFMAL